MYVGESKREKVLSLCVAAFFCTTTMVVGIRYLLCPSAV